MVNEFELFRFKTKFHDPLFWSSLLNEFVRMKSENNSEQLYMNRVEIIFKKGIWITYNNQFFLFLRSIKKNLNINEIT